MLINENLKRIFGAKYYQKITNYISVIQNAIDSYDIVVFMARKAYCFYKALVDSKLVLEKDTCIVLSSRAVTYNGVDFSNKKVAIIEDVVILGESLFETINENKFDDVELNIYMLACSQEFSSKFLNNEGNNKFYSSLILKNDELLELATLITNYIVYEMIPYNADYPAYSFEFTDCEKLYRLFNDYNFCSITDLVHCKNNSITEGVIPVNNNLFDGFLPNNITSESIFKIRVYINTNENVCFLVPIVIFPELTISDLERIYANVFIDKYNDIIQYGDDYKVLKNKLRILCYKLAELLLFNFLTDLTKQFDFKKISSEKELFTTELLVDDLSLKINTANQKQTFIDGISLYNSLGYAYDLLIDNFEFVSKTNLAFKSEYITFNDIKEKISIVETNSEKLKLISSLILDVFIDNGVIVPRTRFNGNSILRIFKFGEVAKLTAHDFVLFALVLGEYSDLVKRTLDKTEIEKVSVIFFKNYNNNFDVVNNEAEAYRICYSKFGPRIASSNVQYSVSQGQALTDVLINQNFLEKIGEKYNTRTISQDEDKNKVKELQRTLFATKLQKLNNYFVCAQKNNPNHEVFTYINSYIRLITLISIGNCEQDKLLSLIAEVDLIKCRSLSKYENLPIVINILNGIVDGILSGVWKYYCYKKENLLNNILNLMCSSTNENNAMLAIDIFWELSNEDKQIIHKEYFDEIGVFLCDIVVFYYYLCKYTKSKIHDDYSKPPYKKLFGIKPLKEIFEKYKQIFLQKKEHIESFIFEHIREIDTIAYELLDKFEIFDKTSSLKYETYTECIVIFDLNGNKVENIYRDLRTYRYKDMIVIPIEKQNKEYVLNRICGSLNDVNIKALYYASNNEHILLYSTASAFYGIKFLEEVCEAKEFIQGNIQSTMSKELLILPKKEFDSKELQTNKFLFEYIEKSGWRNGKNIYKYFFKEYEKMNITNNYVFGNMYNVEQISGDLNLLSDKCQNPEVKKYIEEAKEAVEVKDESKFKASIKWLGEHAIEFIKDVSAGVVIELINGGITF